MYSNVNSLLSIGVYGASSNALNFYAIRIFTSCLSK